MLYSCLEAHPMLHIRFVCLQSHAKDRSLEYTATCFFSLYSLFMQHVTHKLLPYSPDQQRPNFLFHRELHTSRDAPPTDRLRAQNAKLRSNFSFLRKTA